MKNIKNANFAMQLGELMEASINLLKMLCSWLQPYCNIV